MTTRKDRKLIIAVIEVDEFDGSVQDAFAWLEGCINNTDSSKNANVRCYPTAVDMARDEYEEKGIFDSCSETLIFDNEETVSEVSNSDFAIVCAECNASLMDPDSIVREYVNKDSDSEADNVHSNGHYDTDGNFVTDSFGGFHAGRFDIVGDSDSCASCNGSL